MAEEEKNEQQQIEPTNEQYIEALQKMQENTVPKSEYQKLKEENRQLLNAFVNGEKIEKPVEKATGEELDEMRNKLFNTDKEISNLDYVKTALQLRKGLIDNGQRDPFLPSGSMVTPTANDVAAANKVAEIFQECIDYAEGDSELFTQELMRRTNDVKIRK